MIVQELELGSAAISKLIFCQKLQPFEILHLVADCLFSREPVAQPKNKAKVFDHIGDNFPEVLYLIAIFGQPRITSSIKTKHKAFHHIQRPATHLTT